MGGDHPRRVRADGDHGIDRQYARLIGQARFDGEAAARCCDGDRRPGDEQLLRRGRGDAADAAGGGASGPAFLPQDEPHAADRVEQFRLERVVDLPAQPPVQVGSLAGELESIAGADENPGELGHVLTAHWSLATALALLAWYVFAPQCASTLSVVRRETNSWKWTAFLFSYMLALAYVAAFATYQIAAALGAG